MPGPKYKYLNVEDNLKIGEGGSGQISFRDTEIRIFSNSDGNLKILADTGITLDADVDIDGSHRLTTAGNVTITGDLTRRSIKYISGTTAATTTSGYTRCTAWLEIQDEGLVILSGKSGNICPKLPATPTIGKSLTCTYIHSGNGGTYTAKLSGSSIVVGSKSAHGKYYYVTFDHPGQSITLVNDGSNYYFAHPSGATGGPTLSAALA